MIILEVLAWAALIVMVIIGILAIGVYMLVKDIRNTALYIQNRISSIANVIAPVPKYSNYKSLSNYSKIENNVDRIKEEIEIIEEDISNLYLRIRDLEEKKND